MDDTRRELFDLLAAVLQYPAGDGYRERLRRAANLAEACPALARFAEEAGSLGIEELQELYVHTFELNPVCSLEAGWHLFGENYERGEFLVKMRQEIRRHELTESTELPDHLTHVLPVLGRMESGEAEEFVAAFLRPALNKMRPGLEGKDNPYEDVLAAIDWALETYFTPVTVEVRR